jgi:4-amino-4-deoxy-L-arabinose transferase-like glycosyltransferase
MIEPIDHRFSPVNGKSSLGFVIAGKTGADNKTSLVQATQWVNPLSSTPDADRKLSRTACLLLAACMVLFLLLRLRWVGHLLVWDEAMTLCTVRSFKAGANDVFSGWFWRHPPLYTLAMLLLQPFQAGFAEKAEVLSVGIATVNQFLLFHLNRRIFGTAVALWSAFMIAVIPGSVFFDVWIKQDHPAVTFGLLALLLLFSGRTLYAGLCLGLALLSKQTAVFYVAAAVLLWAAGACGKRTRKDFLALTLIPALTSGWWYLAVLPKVGSAGTGSSVGQESLWNRLIEATHLRFAVNENTLWEHTWTYYLQKLPGDLSWLGLALAVAGLVFVVRHALQLRTPGGSGEIMWILWPAFVLVPALLLLSVVPNKVPWIIIVLFPAWATLAGLGLSAALSFATSRLRHGTIKIQIGAIAIAVVVIMSAMAVPLARKYESVLDSIGASQLRGALASREAAEEMNKVTKDGERAMVTSFFYWNGIPAGHADPIFACYFVRNVQVLIRSHHEPLEDIIRDIKEYRLDWALLSPPPSVALTLIGELDRRFGVKPRQLSGAFLCQTAEIYRNSSATNSIAPTR